ncbi:MAG: phosphopantothenoylcysteine decarboxylase / phosphopantothenate---cysteine ligase [Gaiellales bacterium]|nr:phosphopantothenoylcysteine decarboxylase / phosphopantothenate---cysteine ligase [Gaiellales bacterium]
MGGPGSDLTSRAPILLGVTGGVAAYRACELVRLLLKAGFGVQVAVTREAERFAGPETFSALSRRPVLRDAPALDGTYPHLDASRLAPLVCIAPCTANTLAKLAHGLADNVVTQSALAAAGPLVIAPAMNVRMWDHPATRANVATLAQRGVVLVGPAEGELAEGEWGMGRMADPSEIAATVDSLLRPRGTLSGRRVLVTSGGTREPLDPVRFIGNRSSGRMGAALADEAARRGAEVVAIVAQATVRPTLAEVIDVETTFELERAALAQASLADVVLMAAAVADYRPVGELSHKHGREGTWSLELEATNDILAAIGAQRRPGQVLVGFAAETGADGVERARGKLARKGLDLVVLNDVSRADIGFDSPDNEVVLVSRDGEDLVGKADKRAIAASILDRVERLLGTPAISQ